MPRESAWSDYQEPLYVPGPGEGMIFFGAQVGHSPARENQPELGCTVCGGLIVFMAGDPREAVPIPFRYDADVHLLAVPETDPLNRQSGVCGSCLRWVRDNWLSDLMAGEFIRRGSNDPIEIPPEP